MTPGQLRGRFERGNLYANQRDSDRLFEGPSRDSIVFSDFVGAPAFGNTGDFTKAVAGAGASIFNPAVSVSRVNHPGLWCCETGSTAAGRTFILTEAAGVQGSHSIGVGGITRVGTWLETGLILSTAIDRYTLRAGFSSMLLPNTINEGVTFEYDDSQNGGRWQAICGDAPGVETSVDTGVTVTAATWYKLEFEINEDGTSVDFFIDNSLVATITTNIPAGAGFTLFYSSHIMKLIGTGNRSYYHDATYIYQRVDR